MNAAAIIGTRSPDRDQSERAGAIAQELSRIGVSINTGAALGIDQVAMQCTAEGLLNVFLPWVGYNATIIPHGARITVFSPRDHKEWAESVLRFHPAADRLTRGAFALHARNYGIVRPTRLVVAFPDEKGRGGTGQGIRIAKYFRIPLMQFNKSSAMPSVNEVIDQAVRYVGASQ